VGVVVESDHGSAGAGCHRCGHAQISPVKHVTGLVRVDVAGAAARNLDNRRCQHPAPTGALAATVGPGILAVVVLAFVVGVSLPVVVVYGIATAAGLGARCPPCAALDWVSYMDSLWWNRDGDVQEIMEGE
jgi:hypothetical protein